MSERSQRYKNTRRNKIVKLMEKQQTDCTTIVIQIYPNSPPKLQFCSTNPYNDFKIISPATKQKIPDNQKSQNKTNYCVNGRSSKFKKKRPPNQVLTGESGISDWNQQQSFDASSPNNWSRQLLEASSILEWNKRPLIEKSVGEWSEKK